MCGVGHLAYLYVKDLSFIDSPYCSWFYFIFFNNKPCCVAIQCNLLHFPFSKKKQDNKKNSSHSLIKFKSQDSKYTTAPVAFQVAYTTAPVATMFLMHVPTACRRSWVSKQAKQQRKCISEVLRLCGLSGRNTDQVMFNWELGNWHCWIQRPRSCASTPHKVTTPHKLPY